MVGSFLPAVVFASLQWCLANFVFLNVPLLKSWSSLTLFTILAAQPAAVVILVASLVLAILSQLLSNQIIRLFEGYYFPTFFLFARWKKRELQEFDWIHKRVAELEDLADWTPKQEDEYEELRTKIARRFPDLERLVLPTRFGNVTRAAEYYPDKVYNMDAIAMWPRLMTVIDKGDLEILDTQRSSVDLFLNLTIWFFVVSIEILLVAIASLDISLSVIIITLLISRLLLGDKPWIIIISSGVALAIALYILDSIYHYQLILNWPLAVFALFCLITSWLCHKEAIYKIAQWGLGVESYFDRYRLDLAAKLGYKLPDNLDKERKMWKKLNQTYLYLVEKKLVYANSNAQIEDEEEAVISNVTESASSGQAGEHTN